MTYNPDQPAWDQLCALTTARLLAASSPADERYWWWLKIRTRKVYEAASDPDAACRRMLAILQREVLGQQSPIAA